MQLRADGPGKEGAMNDEAKVRLTETVHGAG